MIMMLSICCHAMPSLTIFKQALSILLWLIAHDFLQATKLNCQKCYVFSNANTLLFSHENNAGVQIFSHSLTFFLQTRDRKKKNCFEHRTMKALSPWISPGKRRQSPRTSPLSILVQRPNKSFLQRSPLFQAATTWNRFVAATASRDLPSARDIANFFEH